MTVKELYNWCKACKHKEAEVYLVVDWEQCDEQGNLTDLHKLKDISMQHPIIDVGLDFEETHEALLEVDLA